MRRSRQVVDRSWPSWRYGPNGESAIFQCEADVPEGWTKKIGDPIIEYEPREGIILDRDALLAELIAKGIEINPQWGTAHMKKVLES